MHRVRSSILFLAAILVAARSARAQQTAGRYAPLEFLVGNCWVGTFTGGSVTDTHCFEWMYDRKFIRDRHVVSSTPKYEGETIYAWDPETNGLVFRYVSNQGLLLNGSVRQQGDSIVFPSTYANDKGERVELRVVWTRVPDGYRAVQLQREGSRWAAVMDVTYHRAARKD